MLCIFDALGDFPACDGLRHKKRAGQAWAGPPMPLSARAKVAAAGARWARGPTARPSPPMGKMGAEPDMGTPQAPVIFHLSLGGDSVGPSAMGANAARHPGGLSGFKELSARQKRRAARRDLWGDCRRYRAHDSE